MAPKAKPAAVLDGIVFPKTDDSGDRSTQVFFYVHFG